MRSTETNASHGREVWLYGRSVDLLVGCGLGYLIAVPPLLYYGLTTGTTDWPIFFVVGASMLLNAPHYGATLLRVYEEREERHRYAFFAVYVTAALAVALFSASYSVLVASLLITAYVTWSPWHFSGQNYGLALLFLRRRGVDVDPRAKRYLYLSFVLSAALAILVIQTQGAGLVFAPHTLAVPNAPRVLQLAVPGELARGLLWATALLYLACLGAAGLRLRRNAGLADLAPALVLVLTQALWFAVPALALDWKTAPAESLPFAAIWISTAHSIQYLWVTAYFDRRSHPGVSLSRFFGRAFLAGSAVTLLPGFVMAPHLLGRVPWDAGLAATVFSVVNLHHFILDGAIWKLRDGRVARVLLRPAEATPETRRPATVHRWRSARRVVWTIAGLSVLIPLLDLYETRVAIPQASHPGRIESATQVLRWIGRETTLMQLRIGRVYAGLGYHQLAIAHFERSIELFPTPGAWLGLANEYRATDRRQDALRASREVLALKPNSVPALLARAEALSMPGHDPADRAEAEQSLERVLELDPENPSALQQLRGLGETTPQRDDGGGGGW